VVVDVDVEVDDGLQASGFRLRPAHLGSKQRLGSRAARLEPRPSISVVSPGLRLGGRASGEPSDRCAGWSGLDFFTASYPWSVCPHE